MQRSLLVLLGIVALLVCVVATPDAYAQKAARSETFTTPYFYEYMTTAAAYEASQNDTLPSGSSVGKRLCAAEFLTCTFEANDTCAVDIYVQRKGLVDTVWATVKTDSCIVPPGTHGGKEVILRSGNAEAFTGITGRLRVVLVFRGSGNGVSGNEEYAIRWNYRW